MSSNNIDEEKSEILSPKKENDAAPQERMREYDDIFTHLRSFGRYQKLLYLSLSLLIFPIASQFSGLVFAYGTPLFHCVTANVTCPLKKCCDKCSSYAFDGPFQSTVSEWDLICDRAYLGAITQSCYFAGMLFGSFVTGMMSDAWGRKSCMFYSTFVMLVAGIVSSLVDCVSFFSFLRFIVGFGLTGTMLTQYVYCMELVGPKQRTAAGNISYIFYGGFGLAFVLVAYLIRDWRILMLVCTIPSVLLFPFWRWIPESPRWLIAHNQLDEAHRVLMLYGGKKGKPVDSQLLRTMIDEIRRDQIAREKKAKKYTPIDLVRTPKLRKWTIIMCYQWFVVALVGFGISLFMSQLAGDVYLNVAFMGVASTLKVAITWIMYLKWGRRISHTFYVVSTGISILLVLMVYDDYPMVTTALFLLGKSLANCMWTGVYLITTELYPTVLRNTAQGTGSTFARVGGILAPYIAMMSQLPGLGVEFPAAIFGVLALVSGILMYWIPETLRSPMHQTIEEAEAAKDDYGIPCCGKPLKQENEDVEMDAAESLLKDTADTKTVQAQET